MLDINEVIRQLERLRYSLNRHHYGDIEDYNEYDDGTDFYSSLSVAIELLNAYREGEVVRR